jgi:hypothetical protein
MEPLGSSQEIAMRIIPLFATVAMTAALASAAMAAPALDAAGKCRDAGKFVKAELCKTSTPAGGKCRDIKTKKFAKCGTPGTEAVPLKTKP